MLHSKLYKNVGMSCLVSVITVDLIFVIAAAVGQPWARMEQPHPYPGPGDLNVEPAHHHGEHMHGN